MKRKALFIGVDDYSHPINRLQYAANDARELWALFKHRLGYGENAVLVDNKEKSTTVDTIVQTMRDLGPGDLFIFYFAGHGTMHNNDHLLLCRDANLNWLGTHFGAISLKSIKDNILEQRCHCLMILDACRNELRGGRRGAQAGPDGCGLRDICAGATWTEKERQGQMDMPDLAIYYGCKEGFCSQESEQLRQGIFSYALKSVFERGASCEIRFNDVFRDYVKHIMKDRNSEGLCQEPVPYGELSVPLVEGGVALDLPKFFSDDPEVHSVKKCACVKILGFSGEYDGGPHGIELCEPPPEGAKVTYSMDGGRTRTSEKPQFVEVCSRPVHVWIETKEGSVSEGEGRVTIRARCLQNWMVHGTDVIVKPDGSVEPKLKIEDVAPHRLEAGKDWRIAECRPVRNGYEVIVEGMRNYGGRITVQIAVDQPLGSDAVMDLLDQYRVLLQVSGGDHAKANRMEQGTLFIEWQRQLYESYHRGKKRVDSIDIGQVEHVIAQVERERKDFCEKFEGIPFFTEHQRLRVELIAAKLADPIAGLLRNSIITD